MFVFSRPSCPSTSAPVVHRSALQGRSLQVTLPFLMLGFLLSWAGGAAASQSAGSQAAGAIAQTPQRTPPATPQVPGRTPPAAPPAVQRTAPVPPRQPATPPPPELTQLITQIDQTASRRDLPALMQFYSRNLVHSDGVNYAAMETALKKFWERFPNATYQTVINDWSREGNALIAETTTTVTGTQRLQNRPFTLTATISSRQRFEGGKIVRQDILSESSQLRAGRTPPTVSMQLPEQVQVGRPYGFDAIVQEPLGDRLLLGTALEEPVNAQGYLNSPALNFEILPAGGLFKVGRAPNQPENRWLSAVIVREDGITIETRRLPVVRGR